MKAHEDKKNALYTETNLKMKKKKRYSKMPIETRLYQELNHRTGYFQKQRTLIQVLCKSRNVSQEIRESFTIRFRFQL